MNYCRQLDGLRGVAVLLVLAQHFFPEIGTRLHAGFIGINLFFVLSGFLITVKLDQSKAPFRQTLASFYLHRFARIIPIYYLLIFILFFLNVAPLREYTLSCLLFNFNIAVADHNIQLTPITHFWSLAVEMQFYLIWPFVILPLAKNKSVLQLVLLIIIILAFLQFYLGCIPALIPYRWVSLFPLIFAMASGSLGYYIYKRWIFSLKTAHLLWLDIFLCMICGGVIYLQHWTMFIILTTTSVYFVVRVIKSMEQNDWVHLLLGNRPMVYLGTISYGIYLFHLPIFFGLRKLTPDNNNGLIIIATFILTVISAALSYQFFENPLRRKLSLLSVAKGK
jgi:peptidoglycan/LPS O-acetylase OafA/YrhL